MLGCGLSSLILLQVVPDVSHGFNVPSFYVSLREQMDEERETKRREAACRGGPRSRARNERSRERQHDRH